MTQDAEPPPQEHKDFFISYTGRDSSWAEWIAFELEAAGYSTVIQAWDATTGKNLLTYDLSAINVSAVAWSPDGTRIAASGDADKTVQVWDTSTGATLLTYSGHSGGDVKELFLVHVPISWSPDGRRIASGGKVLSTCS